MIVQDLANVLIELGMVFTEMRYSMAEERWGLFEMELKELRKALDDIESMLGMKQGPKYEMVEALYTILSNSFDRRDKRGMERSLLNLIGAVLNFFA